MARALPALELDDPLRQRPVVAATKPEAAEPKPEPAKPKPKAAAKPRTAKPKPAPAPSADETATHSSGEDGTWREWGRGTRTATYRLPDDLLVELDARARRLGLPLGMTVAAGVLILLDRPDDEVVAAVERAEDARLHAARLARRG